MREVSSCQGEKKRLPEETVRISGWKGEAPPRGKKIVPTCGGGYAVQD